MTLRVGCIGFATAGKDVIADALVAHRHFQKVNMSDALLGDMLVLDPYVGYEGPTQGDVGRGLLRASDIVNEHGYDEAKRLFPEFRRLLQDYGTDVVRKRIEDDCWVRRAGERAAMFDRVVTTGIRFENELDGIDYLIYVTRPGVGPINNHISDDIRPLAMARADGFLVNDGTVEDLQAKALSLYDLVIEPRFRDMSNGYSGAHAPAVVD